MNLIPVKLQRQGEDTLLIEWSNGVTTRYNAYRLRKACPCATCREKAEQEKNSLPVLTEVETTPMQFQKSNLSGGMPMNLNLVITT